MNFKQFRVELEEKYRSKFPAELVAAAVKIALDMGGNMTGAYKKIERMKKGLGDDPIVKDALRLANEDVQEASLAKKNEKLVDLFNQLLDVKHGGAEFKAIKRQIEKLQNEKFVPESTNTRVDRDKILNQIKEWLSPIKRGRKLEKKDIPHIQDHLMHSYLDKSIYDKLGFDDDAIYLAKNGKNIVTSRDYLKKMTIDDVIKLIQSKVR